MVAVVEAGRRLGALVARVWRGGRPSALRCRITSLPRRRITPCLGLIRAAVVSRIAVAEIGGGLLRPLRWPLFGLLLLVLMLRLVRPSLIESRVARRLIARVAGVADVILARLPGCRTSVLLVRRPGVALRRALAVSSRFVAGFASRLIARCALPVVTCLTRVRRSPRVGLESRCRTSAWLRCRASVESRRGAVAEALAQLLLVPCFALGALVLRLRQCRALARCAARAAHRPARCGLVAAFVECRCGCRFVELESDHGNLLSSRLEHGPAREIQNFRSNSSFSAWRYCACPALLVL